MRNTFNRPSRPVVRPAFIEYPESRKDLLPWAAQHNYPAFSFTGIESVELYPVQGLPPAIHPMKYAVGVDGSKENKSSWETAAQFGSDDMIEGLLAHINTLSKEQLETMRKTRR